MSAELTPSAVIDLFAACTEPGADVIQVDTVAGMVELRTVEVQAQRDAIRDLLAELPDEFKLSGGGGWSFLNACTDRHGELWTGEHRVVAMLLALGQAAGFVTCQMPRDLWPVLPGGMPYYAIDDRGWS